MQTKLTLRMDSALIDKAKKWARARNVSLSEAMAGFFELWPADRFRGKTKSALGFGTYPLGKQPVAG